MSVRDWLFDRFFSDVHARRVDALRAASSRAKQVEGFRRLTDVERDLNPVTHDRQREIAVYLYTYNPLARRMMEIIREWILGEGVTVKSEHPKAQDYLDRFWGRPNRWDTRLWEQTLELFLMGERFWPIFANQFDGMMRFGVIDPSRVKEVVLDPDNVEVMLGIVLKARPGEKERRLRTVLTEEDLGWLTTPALREWEAFGDGELMPFMVNKLSTQSRGISELFSMSDWLDGYEQLLFAILQREQANGHVMWDVKLEGFSEEQVGEWLGKQAYPKPLSIRAHNEKVEWKLVGPEAGSSTSNVEHARLFRNHVLGGEAIPEHWWGGGGDVNRATASEMGTPTEKSLTAKQRTVKYVVEDVLRAQIDRAISVGALPDDEGVRDPEVTFPELSTRDLSKIASGIQSIAAGLVLFGRQGWVDAETSVQVLSSMLQQMGVELDATEVLDRARKQKAEDLANEAVGAMGGGTLPIVEA